MNTIPAALVGRLRIAVAELSGLVVVGDRADYENLTEETFSAILDSEVSLSAVRFATISTRLQPSLLMIVSGLLLCVSGRRSCTRSNVERKFTVEMVEIVCVSSDRDAGGCSRAK